MNVAILLAHQLHLFTQLTYFPHQCVLELCSSIVQWIPRTSVQLICLISIASFCIVCMVLANYHPDEYTCVSECNWIYSSNFSQNESDKYEDQLIVSFLSCLCVHMLCYINTTLINVNKIRPISKIDANLVRSIVPQLLGVKRKSLVQE